MMMSPEMFAGMHKDNSFEELIEVRNDLVDEVKELEKIVYDKNKTSDAWNICPGPDVRYQVNLEYLSQICTVLSKKYNAEVVNEEIEQ